MSIDWFTILAQAINFLILIGLMKHFLYKPILNAIEAREKKSAAEQASLEQKNVLSIKETTDLRKKNEDFDRQRAELLNQAQVQAREEGAKILEDIQKQSTVSQLKAKESLKDAELKYYQEISRRTQNEVFAIARKVLTDLSDVDLEERIVRIFLKKWSEITEDEKKRFRPGKIAIRSSFDLSAAQRELIENKIRESLGSATEIHFEKSLSLIGGIEVSANGLKVAWTISDYLAKFQQATDKPPIESGHVA